MHSPRPLVLLAFVLGAVSAARAQNVPVIEKTLQNGMRLLMVERKDEPSFSGGWVAHVGSANERPGITGIAHLFEHMMFKGTRTIGTKDVAKDLEVIAAQEKVRGEMRDEEAKVRERWRRGEIDDPAKPENKTERYRELEKKFHELIAEQRKTMVKNEFDRIYQSAGASGLNAFTSEDMTGYFITLPANKLELWMWMESDRLREPVFREFYAERDVVFEERRMRTESPPLGRLNEQFEAMVWQSHPYSWPVVGWPSDIPAITKAQADDFYATYYAPQNLTLILVGDFDPAKAEAMATEYFGRIPRGNTEAPEVVTQEIAQLAEKRLDGEAEANSQVAAAWQGVPHGHRDYYALDLLAQILSTRTGRFYKGLVLNSKVATDVYAAQDGRKWAGVFYVGAEAREGRTPEDVEKGLYAEIAKVQQEEVPAEELQKAKNTYAASRYRRLRTNMSVLMELIRADGMGNWREVNEAAAKYEAVTAADVRRVAQQYLKKETRNVAIYRRKAAGKPAPAEEKKL